MAAKVAIAVNCTELIRGGCLVLSLVIAWMVMA